MQNLKVSRKKTDPDIAYNDITVGTSNTMFLHINDSDGIIYPDEYTLGLTVK